VPLVQQRLSASAGTQHAGKVPDRSPVVELVRADLVVDRPDGSVDHAQHHHAEQVAVGTDESQCGLAVGLVDLESDVEPIALARQAGQDRATATTPCKGLSRAGALPPPSP
jgi:hypothetical protein